MGIVRSLGTRVLTPRSRARIPRILHYCWFGGTPPQEVREYIATWTAFNPGYRILDWTEANAPRSPFVDEALALKRYALASDYVRFAVLHRWGGIYLDTDVQVMRSFEPLLHLRCFLGFQYEPDGTPYKPHDLIVNGAVIGARPRHAFLAEMLRRYPTSVGEAESALPAIPRSLTSALIERGLRGYSSEPVEVDGVTILPKESFYPYFWGEEFKPELMEDSTYAVHHWAHRW